MIEIDEIVVKRKELDATQVELAQASGVSQSLISNIESGARTDVKLSTLRKLQAGLQKLEQERASGGQNAQGAAA